MTGYSSAPPLRAGLVQFRPKKADVEANLGRIREFVSEAAGTHDVLVFPEASLTGYFLQGGVLETALDVAEVVEGLGTPPEDAPDLQIGFWERWRHRLYNAVAWLTPAGDHWAVVHVHRKMFLPTYGLFDEARFVGHGTEIRAFDTRFGRVGMMICEELWHSLPATILAVGGAEAIFVSSASPARDFAPRTDSTRREPRTQLRWERLVQSVAQEHGVFVGLSQLVGSEGGKIFAGVGLAVDPDGTVIAHGTRLKEEVVTARLDPSKLLRTRAESPLLDDLEQMLPHLQSSLQAAVWDGAAGLEGTGVDAGAFDAVGLDPVGLDADGAVSAAPRLIGGAGEPEPLPRGPELLELDLELVTDTLVDFIRQEVVEHRGFDKVVLGVSGGVDSAVATALACRALGAENVHGFRLPYATSSQDSLDHADLLFETFGAQSRTIEITGAVDGYLSTFEEDASPQRRGNVMARMRAMILFDQSAKLRALPLGTGNKSERLLGYYTWHADDSPPINPLGDLFKTQVWALARHLGVPSQIVDKPASADLIVGVHDEDELGIGYPEADPILYWLVRGMTPAYLVARGFDAGKVEIVARRLHSTHWKRELPTTAMLTSTAIGESYLRPVDYRG